MTVAELIDILKALPPTMRIMVQGYEGGLEDPTVSKPALLILDTIDSSVYGLHALKGEGWDGPTGTVKAVILKRSGR